MTSLSTHVLDVGEGRPGAGIGVVLEQLRGGDWVQVGTGTTNDDGRLSDLGSEMESGTYRIAFQTGVYGNSLFPEVHLVIAISDTEDHYHVPLLLGPYAYTAYRGS